MSPAAKPPPRPNLLIVAQNGRLQYEALIFTASLAALAPHLLQHLYIAEPQPGPLWPQDPRLSPPVRDRLLEFGAQILPLHSRHFGADYPYGNKIEALRLLPRGEAFLFFDSDTLLLQPPDSLGIDFTRPSASIKVEGTWPEPQPYVASLQAIWEGLYTRFGLKIGPTLDPRFPPDYWQHYLYFNAGWFYGPCPARFGEIFTRIATEIEADPGPMLAAQSLDPWLDQVALPLVIHALGGTRPPASLALDGPASCHYRALPLLYAREEEEVLIRLEEITQDPALRRLLRDWEPAKKLIYQGKGRQKIRPMFDRHDPALRENQIRKTLRNRGWWLR